jgi:plasmid stability protein
MKNVTITLDERTAAWVRIHAAEHDMSVSRLVGEMLREHMREQRDYDSAMQRFWSKKPVRLKKRSAPYPTRDERHDRTGLR